MAAAVRMGTRGPAPACSRTARRAMRWATSCRGTCVVAPERLLLLSAHTPDWNKLPGAKQIFSGVSQSSTRSCSCPPGYERPNSSKARRILCCTCHPGRSTKRSIFRLAAKVFVHSLVFNSFEFLRGPVTFLACRSFKFACCQSQFALRYLFGCSADTSSFTNPIRGGSSLKKK